MPKKGKYEEEAARAFRGTKGPAGDKARLLNPNNLLLFNFLQCAASSFPRKYHRVVGRLGVCGIFFPGLWSLAKVAALGGQEVQRPLDCCQHSNFQRGTAGKWK